MNELLFHAHSGWRWVVVVLLIVVFIKMLVGWLGKKKWTAIDGTLIFLSRIAIYIQVVLGIIYYVMIQKWGQEEAMRFLGEHVFPALLAVGSIEFGAARSKKVGGRSKFLFAFVGFLIAMALVYVALRGVGVYF